MKRLALCCLATLAASFPAGSLAAPASAPPAAPQAVALPAEPAPIPASAALLPAGVEVKVEKVRPAKERLPSLRFLRENLDFIRAQFDRVRQQPVDARDVAADLDPRYLLYQKLLAEALAASDTVGAAEDARSRQHLIESIARLGALEEQLDLMERQLGGQRFRLAQIEDDFAAHQQTALMVVLSGWSAEAPITQVTLTTDDGAPVRIPLSPEQCQSLQQGGVLELFHGFVEPREQVLQVALGGGPPLGGDSGFLTLHPMRDRLTFLRLDLTHVQPAQGGASVRASTWLHEAGYRVVGG